MGLLKAKGAWGRRSRPQISLPRRAAEGGEEGSKKMAKKFDPYFCEALYSFKLEIISKRNERAGKNA